MYKLHDWTEAEKAWIIKHRKDYIGMDSFTKAFNENFNVNVMKKTLHSATKRFGAKTGRDGRFVKGMDSPYSGMSLEQRGYSKEAIEKNKSYNKI